jgi:hypothetical protein
VTTNTADEQTIVNNSIDTAGSLASGLSAHTELIRNYYLEGAATQKALVDAYLNDMARSFREQADKALHYMSLADASDLGTRSVYYTAYEYYSREANRLQDNAVDANGRLDQGSVVVERPLVSAY